MLKIPFATWIANAAAGLTGNYGDVTRQAEVVDCSRQTIYDHAQKVQAAVEDAHDGGPTRATLIEENQQLRQENARLWDWLYQTIEFPPDKQREFTVTATGMGLTLNQALVLLALLLGKKACPSRSTLHRWIKDACRYRSGWVPLFRPSGYHLSGCGAIRLTAICQRRPGIDPACPLDLRPAP